MEGFKHSLRRPDFIRPLTSLFADTKKRFDQNVTQARPDGPESSALQAKLRVQKDRLLAWGLDWKDQSAAKTDDIDGSLDEAGKDVVESIMSTIKNLLIEAEELQKSSIGTPSNTRPAEIVDGLTTSIDTLCDLSRERLSSSPSPKLSKTTIQPSRSPRPGAFNSRGVPASEPACETVVRRPLLIQQPARSYPGVSISSSLISSDRLDFISGNHPNVTAHGQPAALSPQSPPSYELVVRNYESRALAFCSPPSTDSNTNVPVCQQEGYLLVDYGPTMSINLIDHLYPEEARFQELSRELGTLCGNAAGSYTGLLELAGWIVDPERLRCAYAYKIPPSLAGSHVETRSLLYFLQNSGDTDQTNVPSLENRFRLAKNVVAGMLRLHAAGVSHRNFSSNNILFFLDERNSSTDSREWKTAILREPYIAGLHQNSSAAGVDKDPLYLNMYHHPRLGTRSSNHFSFLNDYYSLGLILLEIGLWMPIGKFRKTKYNANDFKKRLQHIYLRKLSGKCGDGYMNAVLFCITAADEALQSSLYADDIGDAVLRPTSHSDLERNVLEVMERCCSIDSQHQPPSLPISDLLSRPSSPPPKPSNPASTHEAARSGGDMKSKIPPEPTAKPPAEESSSQTVLADGQMSNANIKSSGRKVKVWSHEVPALYEDYWRSAMLPKLGQILSKSLSRQESYSVGLCMTGDDADTARPTVHMSCTSTGKVRKILRHLNKELRLFEILVVPGQVVRSKAGKQKKRRKHQSGKQATTDQSATESVQCLNPHFRQKPTCGASIGAYVNGIHLPAVSLGGIVLIDGEPFGMSVHHMLEDEEAMEEELQIESGLQRSMAPTTTSSQSIETILDIFEEDTSSTGYPSEISDFSDVEYNEHASEEVLYPFEVSECPDLEYQDTWSNNGDLELSFDLSLTSMRANQSNDDDDEEFDLGDTLGVDAGRGEAILVTSPAIDDVRDDFFPSEAAKDEDHLCSHTLGHIHASSGLKRCRRGDITHEVDWALLQIKQDRLHARNLIQGGSRYCPSTSSPSTTATTSAVTPLIHADSHPQDIMPSTSLGGLAVHALGRSSGLQVGVILPRMHSVRMPGRAFPSHSWPVRGAFGAGGDSGAWVVDNDSGRVCGYVLAYDYRRGEAYIAPMDVMIEDMGRRLGREVTLPGAMVQMDCSTSGSAKMAELRPGYERGLSTPVPTSPPALETGMSTLSFLDLEGPTRRKREDEDEVHRSEEEEEEVQVRNEQRIKGVGEMIQHDGFTGVGRALGDAALAEVATRVSARC